MPVRFRGLPLILATFAALVSLGSGCGNSFIFLERINEASGGQPFGSGGQTTGGQSGTGGGSLTTGGATMSGGRSNSGGSMNNMAGAASGPPGCETELDCRIPLSYCPGWVERCASCVKPADCALGTACDFFEWRCVPVCKFDRDCPLSRPHCDVKRGVCAQCDSGYRCPVFGQQCIGASCFSCAELPWCATSSSSSQPSEETEL